MFQDRPPRQRWPRPQRFSLSETGRAAEEAYRATIVASRVQEGRASYDNARDAWAASHGVQTDDGLYLCELKNGPKTLPQLVEALENCGKSVVEGAAAVGRIFDAGLIVADPLPPPGGGHR